MGEEEEAQYVILFDDLFQKPTIYEMNLQLVEFYQSSHKMVLGSLDYHFDP